MHKTEYRVVILHTQPRCGVKAPDNNFAKDLDYLNLDQERQGNDYGKHEGIVAERINSAPVPVHFYDN